MTWATSVSILVLVGLSVLDLGPMYATDRRQMSDVRQHRRLMPPPSGWGIIMRWLQLRFDFDSIIVQRRIAVET